MTLKILVIDDETEIAEIIRDLLEMEGYKVESAYDGKSGIEVYLKSKPDLIITDNMMPLMSGVEMIKSIREIHGDKKVKIILSSAGLMHQNVKIEWDLFLRKPPNIEEILKAIQTLFPERDEKQSN
ncbi:response regulator [Peredibacter starrii]|uniref:Response regulator n=1 Tax=Peredibacter starrii TaxID=28202 RepID=A0AAX4HT88_9BACT|nr:response regulator [Peredibacter starrii]WPU66497.1 response regulator [Peredibacter starrii]